MLASVFELIRKIIKIEKEEKKQDLKVVQEFIESKSAKKPGRLVFNRMLEVIG